MTNEHQKPNIAYEKAYAFAIRIVNAYRHLCDKKEYVLSKQLLRSGTSVGANLAEAGAALSRADLSAKVSIAYKECQEAKYWLSLLKDTGLHRRQGLREHPCGCRRNRPYPVCHDQDDPFD